jgi:rfaE bifunctional protein kinase chain/domain
MKPARFQALTSRYRELRIAVIGDFCLDRYFEIDPLREETSLETGLPVHNVVNVRSSPGAAGTILNNLVALGIGTIYPVGFAGEDSEGRDLCQSLARKRGVSMGFFYRTALRRTFCYTKPLLVHPGRPPVELNRLDFKNWTPTPAIVEGWLADTVRQVAPKVNAMIVLDQVDLPETGVITGRVRQTLDEIARERRDLFIIADSRRGLRGYPPLSYKMNARELAALCNIEPDAPEETLRQVTGDLATQLGRPAFVTLAERGLIGASPGEKPKHVAALPCRGAIDIVGAGDSVTANLAAAWAAGARLEEALEFANAAASVVIHQLGTTGTASVDQLAECFWPERSDPDSPVQPRQHTKKHGPKRKGK